MNQHKSTDTENTWVLYVRLLMGSVRIHTWFHPLIKSKMVWCSLRTFHLCFFSLSSLSLLCISELFSDSGWDSDICNSVIYWPSLASGWMPSIIHLSEAAAGPSPKWQLAFSNLITKKGKKAPGYGMEILGEGLLRSDKIDSGTIAAGTMALNTSKNRTFRRFRSYFGCHILQCDRFCVMES